MPLRHFPIISCALNKKGEMLMIHVINNESTNTNNPITTFFAEPDIFQRKSFDWERKNLKGFLELSTSINQNFSLFLCQHKMLNVFIIA